jgi:hypothetical protein
MKKSRVPRISWTKFVSSSLCVLAMTVFFAFSPPAYAQDEIDGGGGELCVWASQTYSAGACVERQKCKSDGTWGAVGSC